MRLIRWSGEAEHIFGWSAGEVLGKRMEDFRWIYKEDENQVAEVSTQLQDGTNPRRFSANRNYHKNGSVVDCEWYNSSMLDGSGKLRSILSLVLDVTDRREAEYALQENEQRWATTLASIGDAVIATDIAGRITFMNAMAEKLTGWTFPEASMKLAKDVFNIIDEHTRQEVENPVTKVLEFGAIVGLANHTILMRRDGTEVPIDDSGAPIRDRNGNITGVVLIFRDITERKKAEESLQTTLKRFYSVLSSMYAGILLVTDEGQIEFANQAFCNYFSLKYRPEELIGLDSPQMIERIKNAYLHSDKAVARIKELVKLGQSAKGEEVAMADGRICLRDFIPIIVDGKSFGRLWNHQDITDIKHAEMALRQSEAMLAEAQRIANIGCWEWDLQSGEVIWSDQMFLIFGEERESFVPTYDRFIALIHPDDRKYTEYVILNAVERCSHYEVEYRINTRQGVTRTVLAQAEFMPENDGQHRRVVGTAMDITERKRADELLQEAKEELEVSAEELRQQNDELLHTQSALVESEERARVRSEELEIILDSVPAGVWIAHDPKAIHITGNKLSYEWLHIPPGANASKSAAEGEAPETFRMFKDGKELQPEDMPVQLSATGKEIHDYEFSFVYPDGTERHVLGDAMPLFDDNGKPRGSVSSFIDITERKRIERALRDSEEEYRYLVENAPISIYELDFAGKRFKRVNDAMSRILGYTRDELMALDPFDLLDKESRVRFQERTCKVLAGEPIDESVAYHIFGKDGREIWAALSIRLIRTDGKFDGALVYALDITDRKRMEDALREAKDDLELRVLERTAELSKAKDAAEAAAQAKSDFLANMSHEIRTPMNAVIGMTSLLLNDETLNPEQRDFIETIRMSGDALMVIINDILDFSKMQENKVVLEDQPFDLRNCVEEALDLVAGKANEKGLNLAYTIDKSVSDIIVGDPNRLRQILSNLLSNAVKFTERGEVKLSVSAQKLSSIHEICFAVQDTGIGIFQDQMDQLFQPFSQVETSATRNYGGTGLGLVISKKLVELMDGKIWAESEPGKGSTFYFTIKAETAPGDSTEHLIIDQPQMVGKHVLIVNDNKTNRRILGAYIYSWGMVPLLASTSREALDWIRRGDVFDTAILDMDMQDMDGMTLADEIRRYNKTLPLVMLTSIGLHLPSDHANLTKPIKPSQLQRILANIISEQLAQKSDRVKGVNRDIQMSSLRILLAEDNVTSQKVAIQMLKRIGYKTDVVANGIEALQALERQPYDLVLMDLRMPVMDGLQATRIIRQRWPDNGPKVVAITAYALQGDKEKCIEAGMDDYLSKPIKMNELAVVLRKYHSRNTD